MLCNILLPQSLLCLVHNQSSVCACYDKGLAVRSNHMGNPKWLFSIISQWFWYQIYQGYQIGFNNLSQHTSCLKCPRPIVLMAILTTACTELPKDFLHGSCFDDFLLWFLIDRFYEYSSGLLHWHWGNHMIAPVPVKLPCRIWVNKSLQSTKNTYNHNKILYPTEPLMLGT